METTIKDRVLLYLGNFSLNLEGKKSRYGLTQKGISENVGGSRSFLSRVLREMNEKGLVKEEKKHIENDGKRRRSVYSLTSKGKEKEKRLRESLLNEKIKIITSENEFEISIDELEDYIDHKHPLLYALVNVDDDGILDLRQDVIKEKTTFVNRKEELKILKENLEKVREEGASVVFIKGELGTGKTTLVREFKKYAEEKKFEFLKGKAYSETSDPYLPFKLSFKNYISEEENNLLFSILYNDTSLKDLQKEKSSFESKRRSVFFELTNEVRNLADNNPMVIFLDDLQWSDRATIHLLNYMVDNLSNSPILFICAYRSETITENHHLKDISARLSQTHQSEEILIEPLEANHTHDMLSSIVGSTIVPQDFVDFIYKITEGNPLFIKEFVDLLSEEEKLPINKSDYPTSKEDLKVPKVVKDVLKRRINFHISEKSRKIAELGSIIGNDISFSLLSKCSEMNENELLDSIEELLERGIWKEVLGDDSFSFNHKLIKTIIYEDIIEPKKKMLHRIVAENIEELYEDQIDDYHSDIGHHYEIAQEPEKAIEHYIKGGEKAEKVFAHEDAIKLYENALDIAYDDKKLDLLEKIGELNKLLGKYDEAINNFEKVIDESDGIELKRRTFSELGKIFINLGEYEKAIEKAEEGLSVSREKDILKCKLLNIKGRIFFRKGKYEKSIDIFNEVKSIAEYIEDKKEIAQALYHIGSVKKSEGDNDQALDSLNRAVKIWEDVGDDIGLSESLNSLGTVYKRKGEFDKAEELFKKTLEKKEKIGDKIGIIKALNNLGIIYKSKGEFGKAMDRYKRSLDIGNKIGEKYIVGRININIATIKMEEGNIKEAKEHLDQALDIQRDINDQMGEAAVWNNLGTIHQNKRNLEEALRMHKKGLEIGKKIGDKYIIAVSLHNIGETYLKQEKLEQSKKNFKKSLRLANETGNKRLMINLHCGLVELYLDLGDREKSLQNAENALELANDVDIKKDKGLAYSSFGRYYREKGKFEKAKKEFRKALNIFDEIEVGPNYSKVLYEQGLLFKKIGKADKAVKNLEEALKYFDEHKIEWWSSKCQKVLDELDL